jgi:hypothetical protein
MTALTKTNNELNSILCVIPWQPMQNTPATKTGLAIMNSFRIALKKWK